jgi:hypothetical protein
MITTTCTAIYVDDNGRCYCAAHANEYLRASIAAKPEADIHETPLGSWERFIDADFAEFGWTAVCEICDRLKSVRHES